uniref:HEPN domain-containing protein n=1 Tax=Agathobacter sp. TaxID=2021311 RepID=UPI0040566BAB
MLKEKGILINTAIFPYVMGVKIGKPIPKDLEIESIDIENSLKEDSIKIDLPRGAYILYLKKIVSEHNEIEIRLLKQYAYGLPFSNEDYEKLLEIIMTPVSRNWNPVVNDDCLSQFGIKILSDENGGQKFSLCSSAIPSIRVETWECIIIDHLKKAAFDVIDCFDFNSTFDRKYSNGSDDTELKISLCGWKFSSDNTEQSLSDAIRSAFMFTLVGYMYGDLKEQYQNFLDYFEEEFFKRVSLIYGIWVERGLKEKIDYIPLYESFYNLKNIDKLELIQILKAILDNEQISLYEKQVLKNRLIEGAGEFHNNIEDDDILLEKNVIKPAVNYIMQREKAKETLESAKVLCKEGKYSSCANRCYYAMMYALKALLERKELLADWKKNELKESETHKSLEIALDNLVSQGILDVEDKTAYTYVSEQRWKCDYSLYVFKKRDADNCISKAESFYLKIENIVI